jgi:hypothetical protein
VGIYRSRSLGPPFFSNDNCFSRRCAIVFADPGPTGFNRGRADGRREFAEGDNYRLSPFAAPVIVYAFVVLTHMSDGINCHDSRAHGMREPWIEYGVGITLDLKPGPGFGPDLTSLGVMVRLSAVVVEYSPYYHLMARSLYGSIHRRTHCRPATRKRSSGKRRLLIQTAETALCSTSLLYPTWPSPAQHRSD